ncbi:MAG TPA: site-2 protease family protein [bacterium]|nr:site-2 protease family protein [bacterium]
MDSSFVYLLIAPPILMALTVHEFAHGLIAYQLGDPTAKQAGRLTLNPLVHLDLVGTIMLFIIHIGWAKPVPVNPSYFKDPKRDLLWVSLAGPASNLMLAFIFGIGCRILGVEGFHSLEKGLMGIIQFMLAFGVMINIVLAVFNLFPIPPLDGSKILMGLIPPKYERQMEPYMRYGPTILIALIAIGFLTKVSILWAIINPFVKFFSILFAGADFTR